MKHTIVRGESVVSCSCGLWNSEHVDRLTRARAALRHLKAVNADPRTGEEMPPAPPVAQCPDRKSAGGCEDEGDGTCRYCGVSLTVCLACGGIGYHRNGCASIEPIGEGGFEADPSKRFA